MQHKHILETSQKRNLLLSTMGAILLILALIFLKSTFQEYQNEGIVVVGTDQTMFFGTDFTNTSSGTWQNEGESYFQKNLVNEGTLNCNSCLSGVTFFNNQDMLPQTLSGAQALEMYDLVVNNAGNLLLESELQIVNSLNFQSGRIVVNPVVPNALVHFKDNAVYAGSSDTKHIQGYVGKTGDDTFVFPVGDGNHLNPLEITGALSSDFFKVAYFSVNSGTTTFSNGNLFTTSSKESTIQAVHNQGFWDVDGLTPTIVKFEWDLDNDLNTLLTDISDLVVAGWDGTEWVNLGQNDLVGSISTGSIRSDPLIPSNYLAYTFARVYAGTFPVEWLSFQVEKSVEGALLAWSTALEIGSDKYEVERSSNLDMGFAKIGEVKAAGNRQEISSYDFMDTEILDLSEKQFFYRLKQIDLDGDFSFSKVIELSLNDRIPELKLNFFPNPAREQITVLVEGSSANTIQFEIINLEGKTFLQQELTVDEQSQIPLGNLSAGNYVIRISDESFTQTKRLIKR